LGALEAQGKFSDTCGALKVTKGSMVVLKAERTKNLYKVIESVDNWWCFRSNNEWGHYKTLAHASWTHERAKSLSPTQQRSSTRY